MKPILAVVHIYYPELWGELKECLKNITVPYDLYVTTIAENQYLEKDILDFNPEVHFEIVENRGYDIGPFIHIINKIKLDDYSYVIKLHTKRDMLVKTRIGNGFCFSNEDWRLELLRFISSKCNFEKCLKALEKKSHLGCCASYKVIHPILNYFGCDADAREKYKHYIFHRKNFKFVAGTMFIVRASLLKKIQDMNIALNLFDYPDKTHSMQLAHIIERSLGEVIYEENCYIKDVFTRFAMNKWLFQRCIVAQIDDFKRFLFQKKITASNVSMIKVFKIPIYRRRVCDKKENI